MITLVLQTNMDTKHFVICHQYYIMFQVISIKQIFSHGHKCLMLATIDHFVLTCGVFPDDMWLMIVWWLRPSSLRAELELDSFLQWGAWCLTPLRIGRILLGKLLNINKDVRHDSHDQIGDIRDSPDYIFNMLSRTILIIYFPHFQSWSYSRVRNAFVCYVV